MQATSTPPHTPPLRQRDEVYRDTFVAPMVGDRFFGTLTRLTAPAGLLEGLAAALAGLGGRRDAKRLQDVVDTACSSVLVMQDHTRVVGLAQPSTPVVCVEIKPKCGFLPLMQQLEMPWKTRVCRYHMHQLVKLREGSIPRVSG